MPEYTLWPDKKEHGWTFCSLGGYSQCLHMCKLYDIRKRKRTTCTHAAAERMHAPYLRRSDPQVSALLWAVPADVRWLISFLAYSISRICFRIGRIMEGETESSSMPIFMNCFVRVVSAPSSPQMPAHFPCLWALSMTIWIMRRIAG